MKLQEEFVVHEPPQRLWEFFEQVDRVARCVPGVEDIEVIDPDNSRLRVTQALGPMSTTFDMKMRITGRDPGRAMQFTAIGRSVKGAAGNIRTANVVRLEDLDGGQATRVVLDADIALGGMIGSVGQKVVARQADKVTKAFAEALEREIKGVSVATVSAAASPPQAPGAARSTRRPAAPTHAFPPSLLRTRVPVPLPLVLAAVFGAGYLLGRTGGRR